MKRDVISISLRVRREKKGRRDERREKRGEQHRLMNIACSAEFIDGARKIPLKFDSITHVWSATVDGRTRFPWVRTSWRIKNVHFTVLNAMFYDSPALDQRNIRRLYFFRRYVRVNGPCTICQPSISIYNSALARQRCEIALNGDGKM